MTEENKTGTPTRPYHNKYKDDLELPDAEPEAPTEETTEEATPEPELSQEEVSYKKRYGDLRREFNVSIQPKLNKLAQLEQELQQLKSQKQPTTQAPETEAEVREWLTKNPDMARIVQSIARAEVSKATQSVKEKVQEVEQRERRLTRAEAERKLLEIHPDFPELRQDPEFIDWLDAQPQNVQDWLYQNEEDPYLAARAIQYYKNEKGLTKKDKKSTKTEAALAVKTKTKVEPTTNEKPTFKMSDIRKMKPKEFERLEAEIDAAWREGRVIND